MQKITTGLYNQASIVDNDGFTGYILLKKWWMHYQRFTATGTVIVYSLVTSCWFGNGCCSVEWNGAESRISFTFINFFYSKLKIICSSFYTCLVDWLINCFVFYAVSAIFQPRRRLVGKFFKFPKRPSLRAYSSLKSRETIFCVPRGLLSLTRGTI